MRTLALMVVAVVGLGGTAACTDTDVPDRGAEAAPGEEREGRAERAVEPVDLEDQPWFSESGTVEFADRRWVLTGEPVFDPMVEYVGEFEGTPLYAEVGVSAPYSKLFIPLEDDYWQMLTPGRSTGPDTLPGQPEGVPGID